MNIMTKRGSQDNVVTYEHYCDTKTDLNDIPQDKITLGSVAIVLKDENDAMGIYIANSNKEWISFSTSGSGGENSMSDISLSNLLDISLTNPTDGQTLVYNGESGKWENKIIDEMIIPTYTLTIDDNDEYIVTCDMSYEEIFTAIKNKKCTCCYIRDADLSFEVLELINFSYYINTEISSNNSIVFSAVKVNNEVVEYPSITHKEEENIYYARPTKNNALVS